MTIYSSNHQFPIPEDGQLDWDDEIQDTITSIDALLKGLSEDQLTKAVGDIGSLNVDTAATIASDTPFQLGDNEQFTEEYDSANGVTAFRDSSLATAEKYLTFTHGDDGAITTHRPLETSSGSAYATESYADQTASVSGEDITPASVNTDSYNGIRMLSSFMDSSTPLQDACDWTNWSGGTNGTVVIDGQFDIDEPTVTVRKQTHLVGFGQFHSVLNFTRDTSKPMFEYANNGLKQYQWFNFQINDAQSGTRNRPCLKPANPDDTGSFGETVMENVFIRNVGGIYPFEIHNAYGSTFSNVMVKTKYSSPTGHFKIVNCNASYFANIKSIYNTAQDGETPCIYIVACLATQFDSPHIEHLRTDAAMQISDGFVTINTPHIEGNSGYPRDYHAGIQIGDGGKTEGNTLGRTSPTGAVIQGGVVHGSDNYLDGIRLLNGDEVTLTNFHAQASGVRLVNYGGSTNDDVSTLTTSPAKLLVFGTDNPVEDIRVEGNISNPQILRLSPRVFESETDARNNMMNFDIGFMNNSTGGHSFVRKDVDGTIHVFDPERTL